ncbi:GNAT family N-acetyltransferase [Sinomicrobium pectinilyticum]|uniref:GNAT family N-acetyltransferase n=1 Tax=Sinomicrobium pectinilyticum TaxID=1084421 RepID=A0A3N0E9J9_SINP1|nr:GNAT family N-acetyltransferase [Sinomicrobium pectinilyticum]RNL84501.1 GNAT family N-acetyltransferase [Sinomicrobium pectinilyticum]
MSLSFKKCTTAHLDVLLKLSKITFTETYAAQNDPEDFKSYMEKAFARELVQKELQNGLSFFYLAYDDGEPVGYFKLNPAGAQTDINEPGTMELERIYLLRSAQGKKLGNDLIRKAIEISREQNAAYMWLGVWDQNTRAIAFYERNGFVKFGEHPFVIGEAKQTDWLMKIPL